MHTIDISDIILLLFFRPFSSSNTLGIPLRGVCNIKGSAEDAMNKRKIVDLAAKMI